MRRRDVIAPLLVTVVLLALALFAAATRFPEAEVLARAQDWPGVGPLVREFRSRYLPAEAPAAALEPAGRAAATGPELPAAPEVEVIQVVDPDLVGIKPKLWTPRGTPIRARPDPRAFVLTRLDRDFPLSRLRRQGDWYQVRYGTPIAGFEKGWVYLPNYREPTAEELSVPAPVLPLAAVAANAETVAVAREGLRDGGRRGRCGGYLLWTDVEDPAVLSACERVGSRIDGAHRRRYGLEPVSEPAETVFLFRDVESYFRFRDRLAPDALELAHAYPALGYVALARGERSLRALSSTLTHELTHLLNRRTLGPALPPWLDEGMARDLARRGDVWIPDRVAGGGIRLPERPGRAPAPSLRELLPLDQAEFRKRASRNYRAAGLWISFFLDAPEGGLRERFEDFLGAIASGAPISEELLLERLGSSWEALERGFADWERGGFEMANR